MGVGVRLLRFNMTELSEKEMAEAKELFVAIQALGFTPTIDEVDQMVADIDADGNATIEFEEFVAMGSGKMGAKDPVEEMKKAFLLFDEKAAGKIGLAEIKKVAGECGEAMSDAELEEVIAECGEGGSITEAAFIEIMKEQQLC